MKKSLLAGIRYQVIAINENEGRYRISFILNVTKENCYLELYLLGDELSQKTQLPIKTLKCNGIEITSLKSLEFGPFGITKGIKVILEIKTNQTDYFSSEVKIYASKE